ncbi:AEC family transporter [Dysosmobacter sp.]
MISLLLLQQIAQLFLCIFLGWLLVRARLLKPEDSRVLSVVVLYLVIPCVIVGAFQIDCTPDMFHGLLLSLGIAAAIHAVLFLLTALCRRPLRLGPVEQASVIYSNAGNLIVPIVSAILGKEWIIFTSMFVIVQLPLLWSHGRMLLSGERSVSWRKIFLNVNILSIFAGGVLFFLHLPLPALLVGAMDSIGATLGPLSMIVAGMLMGGVDFRAVLSRRSIWKVAFLRLVGFPLVILCLLRLSGLSSLVPKGETILLVSFLASITPSASAVTQMAQVYGREGEYAGSINVITTLLCIITMPLLLALYQL